MSRRDEYVKLQRPTDLLILKTLSKKGRNVAPNLALEIDKSRSHVNVRLPILADYELVQKIGPAENSGLYEITERGEAVLELQRHYSSGSEFEELVDKYLAGDLNADDLEYNKP